VAHFYATPCIRSGKLSYQSELDHKRIPTGPIPPIGRRVCLEVSYGTTSFLLRTLVASLALGRFRRVMIIDVALTLPLDPPRARTCLRCGAHYLEPALLPAGHYGDNTVSHHRAVGGKSRCRGISSLVAWTHHGPRRSTATPTRIAPIATPTASVATRTTRSSSPASRPVSLRFRVQLARARGPSR
jgi:hypothetical protein